MKDQSLRRRVARWLDPGVDAGPAPERPAPAHPQGPAGAGVWPGICERFALQLLGHAENLRPALDRLEADEHNEERLEWLYHVDHSVTRIRRAARDLRILAGVEDGELGGYTSSLVDVIRAAESAIEHYSKVIIARVVDLAMVPYASDDISSLLAALLDNATTYSPSTVTVSAHLLDSGSVMLRIEDNGIGMAPGHLEALNAALAGPIPEVNEHAGKHTGFPVVHRLAHKHGVAVRFASRSNPGTGAPGGTIAMVTIPPHLLYEIPNVGLAIGESGGASDAFSPGPQDATNGGAGSPPASPRLSVARPSRFGEQAGAGGQPPATETGTGPISQLPRRTPASLRGAGGGRGPAPSRTRDTDPSVAARSFAEDLSAFNAGEQAGRQRPTDAEPDHSEGEGR
jgi:hypothetical protein